tara:strand:+ start:1223 stop:1603 length:381 start_codon:yes stop_codon:yes gene_type:complete
MTNFYKNLFDTLAVTDLRREANIARTTATDQYETDIANYLDREVGAIEKGIAGLLDNKLEFSKNLDNNVTSTFTYDFGNDQANLGIEKRFANGGQINRRGIMQLPMSEQGDKMTTQMFQNGFRPRR